MTMEGVWRREEETTAVSYGRVLETLSKVIKNNASRAIEKITKVSSTIRNFAIISVRLHPSEMIWFAFHSHNTI